MAARKSKGIGPTVAAAFDKAFVDSVTRGWFRQEQRARKMIAITLSDEARERLDRLAQKHDVTRSAMVEALIMRERTK